jgi:2-dehydropantoate 2-reductase
VRGNPHTRAQSGLPGEEATHGQQLMPGVHTLPDKPTYAVIGCGAVGAFYGGGLQRLGREVHFLLHRDYAHVCRHGLRIDSVNGGFTLPKVHAYANVNDMPRCDAVIVALKTTHNDLLPALLPPVVKDGGIVLVLQNGLGIERQVAQVVGGGRVMGGLCFLCSNKLGPGHVNHLDYGRVEFADYTSDDTPAGITPRMRTVGGDFKRAGNPVVLSEDLTLARWKKLVWNVPFNGLTVLHNTNTAAIMADPTLRTQAHALMLEVQRAARTWVGRIIEDDFIQMMLDWTDKMKPYLPSMKLDHDAGRPLEVEAIFGAPLRAAQAAGCQVPGLSEIYEKLVTINPAH